MDDLEQNFADRIYKAIQHYTTHDDRGAQSARYEVGISDLGFCSERTKRMLAQEDPDDSDMTLAFIGTAIGDHVERAVKTEWGDAVVIQPTVTLHLEGDGHTYDIPGHPDMVFKHGVLIDGKTTRGLNLVRRVGPDRQKRFQVHGYAKAAFDAGLFDPTVKLSEVMVGNVWIDRAGDDKEPHVHLEPFDEDVIFEMTQWLEEVIYAFTHDEAARKEPPREMCAATCGFFGTCRAFDTDVAGLLTDPVMIEAVRMYREGLDMEKAGGKLKDQAKPALKETEGFALIDGERFALRWTHINETVVPAQHRRAYDKIDLRKVK